MAHKLQIKPFLPTLQELFFLQEWLSLKISPIYYGRGVPQGDRSPVILVPGFLGIDAYMTELFLWLKRIDYKPYFSNIGIAKDCPNFLTIKLMRSVRRIYRENANKKVHIIGHSLGGILARSAACRLPDYVASVICLGSPCFGNIKVSAFVANLMEFTRESILGIGAKGPFPGCSTETCECEFARSLLHSPWPASVKQTAIYTKEDGMVDWRSCKTGNRKVDIEVTSTHLGLIFNTNVYRHIARRLAKK